MMEAPDVADVDNDQNTTELKRFYYHTQLIGSVTQVTDEDEVVVEEYDYGPYGEIEMFDINSSTITASAIGNPFTYTGRRLDEESGLYYYRARHYSAELKRFVQRDPLEYADGANAQAYVGGSPLGATDPLGLQEERGGGRGRGSFSDGDPTARQQRGGRVRARVNPCQKSPTGNHKWVRDTENPNDGTITVNFKYDTPVGDPTFVSTVTVSTSTFSEKKTTSQNSGSTIFKIVNAAGLTFPTGSSKVHHEEEHKITTIESESSTERDEVKSTITVDVSVQVHEVQVFGHETQCWVCKYRCGETRTTTANFRLDYEYSEVLTEAASESNQKLPGEEIDLVEWKEKAEEAKELVLGPKYKTIGTPTLKTFLDGK